ncbi:MAG: LytTR family DNA-binding domain-containing protein [Cytophagales bacterium]|nr:LytTR family DNA-binding domain-containing protein [Cytophagales bacterium]
MCERQQYWVNDIKQIRLRRLSFRDRLIALQLALILVCLLFFELGHLWTPIHSFPVQSWLYLNASDQANPSPNDQSWSDEKSKDAAYWIKSKITLDEDQGFNALQVSFSESYLVYWDGYLIGTHKHLPDRGVTRLHPLEKYHVLAGIHHVMLYIPQPRNTLLDLSKKQLLLGNEASLRMMAMLRLYCLIGALGLMGMIIVLFVKHLRSAQTHPKAALWMLGAFCTYLGFALVDTLYLQPFQWSNPALLAIATACSLQLIFTLSRHLPNLQFKSFFSIALATYIIVYFVLGNQQERLILYHVALLLTLYFFVYTTSQKRVSLLWCLVPILPFLSPFESLGLMVMAVPLFGVLILQLFHVKPLREGEEVSLADDTLNNKKDINYLLVNSKSDKKSIPLESVALIKAANNYSIIVINSGETFLHDKSLLKLSSELPGNFKRIHKSYLVNFDQVEEVKNKSGGGKILLMKNMEEVPVGRVYQKELTTKFA